MAAPGRSECSSWPANDACVRGRPGAGDRVPAAAIGPEPGAPRPAGDLAAGPRRRARGASPATGRDGRRPARARAVSPRGLPLGPPPGRYRAGRGGDGGVHGRARPPSADAPAKPGDRRGGDPRRVRPRHRDLVQPALPRQEPEARDAALAPRRAASDDRGRDRRQEPRAGRRRRRGPAHVGARARLPGVRAGVEPKACRARRRRARALRRRGRPAARRCEGPPRGCRFAATRSTRATSRATWRRPAPPAGAWPTTSCTSSSSASSAAGRGSRPRPAPGRSRPPGIWRRRSWPRCRSS